MYEYKGKIIRVVDGDTADILIELGFGVSKTERFRIIAANHEYFDTPETWRPKTENERSHGEEANKRATELLENKTIILHSVKKGKYRYLAEIKIEVDDNIIDYGDLMIKEGFQKKDNYVDEMNQTN